MTELGLKVSTEIKDGCAGSGRGQDVENKVRCKRNGSHGIISACLDLLPCWDIVPGCVEYLLDFPRLSGTS